MDCSEFQCMKSPDTGPCGAACGMLMQGQDLPFLVTAPNNAKR